jgi:hypothetical protein
MSKQNGEKLDKFLSKSISRKLLVFCLSTIFFALGLLAPDQWLTIAVSYIGLQTVTDTIVRIKGSFTSDQVDSAKSLLKEVKSLKEDISGKD